MSSQTKELAKFEGLSESYPHGSFVQWHSHDTCQIAHAISGVMRIRSPNSEWLVPPGRALWVPHGVEHAIRCFGRVEMRTLYLSGALAEARKGFEVWSVSALMRELIVALCAATIGLRRDLLLSLLLMEIEQAPVAALRLPLPRHPRLAKLCDELIADPASLMNAKVVTQKLAISERTFSRLFMAETGMSFRIWLSQARLLKSIELIGMGQQLGLVAAGVGFATQSAFSAAFRTTLSITPSEYRMTMRPSG